MSDERVTQIVVQKYGGSSVADAEKLGRVADRVAETARAGHRVVVVVSAMGKTTDELYALARQITPSPSRRELDMLLSVGERISMALLAMALEHRGLPAISFTGSQSGIITNDRHSGARIIEVRPIRIEDELDRGRIVIVAGFQGMSYRREVTTLGRGGSDTTAVALAAALGAAWCEICSDVDGVYSADPRVVPEAVRLPAVSYDEMAALAHHGAKVLNAEAVAWAERAGIEILARATRSSPNDKDGTTVSKHARAEGPRAVTGTKALTILRGPRALEIAANERLALRGASEVEVRFVRDDAPDWPRIAAQLDGEHRVVETGSVTLVGPALGTDPQLVHKVAATSRPFEMSSIHAHGASITVEVPMARVDDLTRSLHASLVR